MRLILIFSIFHFSGQVLGQSSGRDSIPYIELDKITESPRDTFRVQAKIISIYTCPPCPKGAQCKPCIGDHLTVVGTDYDSRKIVQVFTTELNPFHVSNVYVFTLRFHNSKRREDGTDLVSFEPLKK